MGTDRGAANLAKFNTQRSANVLPLLEHELQLCCKRKLQFRTVGLLASYLSDRIMVHRTTLLRNTKYKALLLAHLAGQPGAVERAPDTTEDPALLQAKLAAAKLEASNLREHLRFVEAQLVRITSTDRLASIEDSNVAFANLAMALALVLNRLPEFLQVDFDKRELHDLSARPSERVLAGPERIGGFCAWVEQNQALPFLQQLKKNFPK